MICIISRLPYFCTYLWIALTSFDYFLLLYFSSEAYFAIETPELDSHGTLLTVNEFKQVFHDLDLQSHSQIQSALLEYLEFVAITP